MERVSCMLTMRRTRQRREDVEAREESTTRQIDSDSSICHSLTSTSISAVCVTPRAGARSQARTRKHQDPLSQLLRDPIVVCADTLGTLLAVLNEG